MMTMTMMALSIIRAHNCLVIDATLPELLVLMCHMHNVTRLPYSLRAWRMFPRLADVQVSQQASQPGKRQLLHSESLIEVATMSTTLTFASRFFYPGIILALNARPQIPFS
jgi:hypothetical protein